MVLLAGRWLTVEEWARPSQLAERAKRGGELCAIHSAEMATSVEDLYAGKDVHMIGVTMVHTAKNQDLTAEVRVTSRRKTVRKRKAKITVRSGVPSGTQSAGKISTTLPAASARLIVRIE